MVEQPTPSKRERNLIKLRVSWLALWAGRTNKKKKIKLESIHERNARKPKKKKKEEKKHERWDERKKSLACIIKFIVRLYWIRKMLTRPFQAILPSIQKKIKTCIIRWTRARSPGGGRGAADRTGKIIGWRQVSRTIRQTQELNAASRYFISQTPAS